MTIPPYSDIETIDPSKYFDFDFLDIFGGLPAEYIKLKSDSAVEVSFKIADRWITFPENAPANVWMDIEDEVSILRVKNPSTSSGATVKIYATTYESTNINPVYKTEIVPNRMGVE